MRVSVRSHLPAVAGGEPADGKRPFGRLNLQPPSRAPDGAEAAPVAGAAPIDPAEAQLTPIDSAKAFVGPNATFYDDRWRWMDWRGRHRSWNWAAAATFGGWFAYRRMYRHAAGYGLWLVLLAALAAVAAPLELLLAMQLTVMTALGLYGDTLYLLHFRRIARDVFREHPEYDARVAELTEAGGVDPLAAWRLAAAVVVGAGLVFILL